MLGSGIRQARSLRHGQLDMDAKWLGFWSGWGPSSAYFSLEANALRWYEDEAAFQRGVGVSLGVGGSPLGDLSLDNPTITRYDVGRAGGGGALSIAPAGGGSPLVLRFASAKVCDEWEKDLVEAVSAKAEARRARAAAAAGIPADFIAVEARAASAAELL